MMNGVLLDETIFRGRATILLYLLSVVLFNRPLQRRSQKHALPPNTVCVPRSRLFA